MVRNMERYIFSGSQESWKFDGRLDVWARQISEMIAQFNLTHSNEMLAKSPVVIRDQFLAGESVLIISSETDEVLYHGSLYPLLGNEGAQRLGMQVVEFGFWIVPERYRGQGLGTEGCRLLKELAAEKWGKYVGLATNKRVIAAMAAIGGGGMTAVNFVDFPTLSRLTCVCASLQDGKCPYRRGFQETIAIDAGSVDLLHNGGMACTLLVTDVVIALEFERICQEEKYGR